MTKFFSNLTIKTKLVLAYTTIFGILIGSFAVVTYRSIGDSRMARLDAELDSHAGKLLMEIDEDMGDQEDIEDDWLSGLTTEDLNDAHLQLLTVTGAAIVKDSLLQTAIADWPSKYSFKSAQHVNLKLGTGDYRVLWQPVEIDGTVLYVLELAMPMQDMLDDMEQLRLLFWILVPAILLITGMAAYGITQASFRPIVNMTNASRNISVHNLNERLDLPKTQDEVRLLGETLNGLLERLDSSFRSQRQFVADASHEIRTPLAVMRVELEHALGNTSDSLVRADIQSALTEIDRLSKMAGQLLLLARLDSASQSNERESVRIDELLAECVRRLKAFAESKNISLELYIEEAIEYLGDSEKLKSVFDNIIENAIKYCPSESSVQVSLARVRDEHKFQVTISDNGPGIPEDEQQKVFGRFYRATSQRGEGNGSGLGLAIAMRVIELHGGALTIESHDGKGSTFTISLSEDSTA